MWLEEFVKRIMTLHARRSSMAGLKALILSAAGVSVMSLSGCAGSLQPKPAPASYDLVQLSAAPLQAAEQAASQGFAAMLPLAGLKSPPWLNSTAMHYRLAYVPSAAQRRYRYAESRWVATPADMLRQVLKQSGQVQDIELAGTHCQLQMELDEFIQVFESEQQSQAWLTLRLNLLSHREPRVMAHHVMRLSAPAGGDAASGVAAFVRLSQDLGRALSDWRVQLIEKNPDLKEQCRMSAGA